MAINWWRVRRWAASLFFCAAVWCLFAVVLFL